MACLCGGKEIDFQDLRTPEQKAVMGELASRIMGGLEAGATPFPGQLNAPPDPGQMQAMNIMTNLPYIMGQAGVGAPTPYQPYNFGSIPLGGQPSIGAPPGVPYVGGSSNSQAPGSGASGSDWNQTNSTWDWAPWWKYPVGPPGDL